ncbi:MAG: SCP2 sterol-binding domain-containing protein [bacterium]
MQEVEVPDLGRASILTLMLKQILDRNLQDPRKRDRMRNKVLTVQLRVRRMLTTLFFEADRVRAEDGAHGRPNIEISGDMSSLLRVALGANPLRDILKRRLEVRLRGWRGWFFALRFLPLMQVGPSPETAGRTESDGG